MKEYQAGASAYAEIIIDYTKKKVDILNPEKKDKYKQEDRWSFKMDYLFLTFILAGAIHLLFSKLIEINVFWLIVSCFALVYLVMSVFWLYPKFNEFSQKLQHHEWWGERKVVILKELKSKEYVLPFEFENRVLNYQARGEFEKYLKKVHIRPKQYFIKVRKKLTPQTKEWEVIFYFSKIPKRGELEIEWL